MATSSESAVVHGRDLVFYPEPHEYFTPPGRDGGQRIPNVTTILEATGVCINFAALETMRPGVIEFKRQLGAAVHVDAHAFDDNDLDLDSVDPRVLPYVQAWATWRDNFCALPIGRERRVYHAVLGYCGTLDGIFEIGAKRVLVDIKTGDPDDAGAHLQTAAYQAAYELEYPDQRIHERWAVQLVPDRAVPYLVTNYTLRPDSWRDIQKFQAVLVTYHEQAIRRRRIR